MKERFGKADYGEMFVTNRLTGKCVPRMSEHTAPYYDPVYGEPTPQKRSRQYSDTVSPTLFVSAFRVNKFIYCALLCYNYHTTTTIEMI